MDEQLIKVLEKERNNSDEEIKSQIEGLIQLLRGKKQKSDIKEILEWLDKKRKQYPAITKEVGIRDLQKWHVDPKSGNIGHESGKFYSVIGVKVERATDREVTSWSQPMIHQEECGILGILCKKIDGTMHYLLQAKYEPGNMKTLQLSPTLQATESNLKQAHKGKKPLLAEYFEQNHKGKELVCVVSVEDGGRFYKKTNRNMIVEIAHDEELNLPDNFIWINSYQLKKLLKEEVVVNSLVRSILGSV